MSSFPDIKEIMLHQRYELFPLFVPIDKQLEWIDKFEPYLSPQRFLKNKVEEFDLLQSSLNEQQSALLLRLYQKFLSSLMTLSSHKGILLHEIKEEYEKFQTDYLASDNQTHRYQTLSDLLNEHNLEIRYDTFTSELILIEPSSTILMVPYQNQLCLIKRSYLEYFKEEPNEKYIDPISDYCIQELMDIPIDTQSILDALQSGTLVMKDTNEPKDSTKSIVYLIAEQLDSNVYPSEPIATSILFKPSESLLSEVTFDVRPSPLYCSVSLDMNEESSSDFVFKPIPLEEPIEELTKVTPEPTEVAKESPAPIVEIKPDDKPSLLTGPRHLSRLRPPMKSSIDLLKQVYKPSTPTVTPSITSSRPPLPARKPVIPPVPPAKPVPLNKPSMLPKTKVDPNILVKRTKNFRTTG